MIRHFDRQIFEVEKQLQGQTKRVAAREYALLQTVPGIGEQLGLTILYEIGQIERFPTVKDFLSYCRLVKGTVAGFTACVSEPRCGVGSGRWKVPWGSGFEGEDSTLADWVQIGV